MTKTVPTLLLVSEVAKKLRVSPQFVTRLARRGILRAYRIGRGWRIDEAGFYDWLEEQKVKPAPRLALGRYSGEFHRSGPVQPGGRVAAALARARQRLRDEKKKG